MKITALGAQIRNPDRVNVSIDGKYCFSLDIAQIVELGIKTGQEITDEQLELYEKESEFGKLYSRALEYIFLRPRSSREVRDYLYRKTLVTKYKTRKGEIKERAGVSQSVSERVFERLEAKGHINDESFGRWWVENRSQRKGTSLKKLRSELMQKGVPSDVIDIVLTDSNRDDASELQKIIAKKQSRYSDQQKLIQYLARQGFGYDDIKNALIRNDDES